MEKEACQLPACLCPATTHLGRVMPATHVPGIALLVPASYQRVCSVPLHQVTIMHYDGRAAPTTYGVSVHKQATLKDIMRVSWQCYGPSPPPELPPGRDAQG